MNMDKNVVKKITQISVNTALGGMLAGGIGALIGAISSLDKSAIDLAVDKLLPVSKGKETEVKEEVETV